MCFAFWLVPLTRNIPGYLLFFGTGVNINLKLNEAAISANAIPANAKKRTKYAYSLKENYFLTGFATNSDLLFFGTVVNITFRDKWSSYACQEKN